MQTLTVATLGERALIERITARLTSPPWVIVGPGDDAAVIQPERGTLDVLTADALVEGIHFDCRFVPPEAIGHRALAVNLSDLAAMGARPRAALLSLALNGTVETSFVDRFMDGLLEVATTHGVALIGGNITSTPGPMMVDITAIGSVRPRRMLRRSGARSGDGVYVTGTLGDAAVGLQALRAGTESTPAACTTRYLRPEPRVRAGLLLGRNRAASSCMDLSDGLADAIRQVATASAVGITIDAAALPISADARHWHEQHGTDAVHAALAGGDDYELLFTVRATQRGRLRGVSAQIGDLPITRVGVVTKSRELMIRDERGLREMPSGFEHFR